MYYNYIYIEYIYRFLQYSYLHFYYNNQAFRNIYSDFTSWAVS